MYPSTKVVIKNTHRSSCFLVISLIGILVITLAVGSISESFAQTTTLDVAGDWTGNVEFSVWFDSWPSPVTCSYAGTMEMTLYQNGNRLTGSSHVQITSSNDPGGYYGEPVCFSWHASSANGNVSGDLFGSAFEGDIAGNTLTGSFTSDTFTGDFSGNDRYNFVNGAFTLNTLGFKPKPQGDITPPVLTVPSNISVEATSSNGAVVTYSVSATDNVDGILSPTCYPPSGSTFSIGPTTVLCV